MHRWKMRDRTSSERESMGEPEARLAGTTRSAIIDGCIRKCAADFILTPLIVLSKTELLREVFVVRQLSNFLLSSVKCKHPDLEEIVRIIASASIRYTVCDCRCVSVLGLGKLVIYNSVSMFEDAWIANANGCRARVYICQERDSPLAGSFLH